MVGSAMFANWDMAGHFSQLHLLQLFYLMLPIYFANMAPPFVRFWPGWNRAISQRYLGSHKTVLGFLLGVATAVAVTFVQSRIGWSAGLIDMQHWLAAGAAMGAGAMLGDSTKSFFKRRLKIAPGKPWIPFDQLDFVAGGLLAVMAWIDLSVLDVGVIAAFSFLADICINHLSFHIGIRDTKW